MPDITLDPKPPKGPTYTPAPDDTPYQSIESMGGGDDVSPEDLEHAPLGTSVPGEESERDTELDDPLQDPSTVNEADEEGEGELEEEGDEETDLENAEEEGAEASPADPRDDRVITLKGADGKPVETTFGAMRQAFEELPMARKAFESIRSEYEQIGFKAHQALEAHRANYAKTINNMESWLMTVALPEFEGVDMNKLARDDPSTYVAAKARMDEINGALNALKQARDAEAEKSAAEGREARAAAVRLSQQTLKQAIPNWNDQIYHSLLKTAVDAYGFAPGEVAAVIDPRLIKVLHDAAKYRELQGRKGITAKKVQAAPKRISRGGVGGQFKANGGVTDAAKRFMKSRSDEDAVRYLLAKGK